MPEKKLKILFISSWYPTRLNPLHGISIRRNAQSLVPHCEMGVVYICSDTQKGLEINTINGVYTVIVYFKQVKNKIPLLSFLVKGYRYMAAWKRALAMYRGEKGKPDLINSNIVYPVSIMASLIKVSWGVPYIITERWSGYFPENGRYKGFFKKLISKIAVSRAAAVTTPSAMLGKAMQAKGLKNRYVVIPNVVNTELFNIAPPHPSQNHIFHFMHISTLSAEKNAGGLLRAFRKFHAANPLSKLTVIWEEQSPEYVKPLKEFFAGGSGIYLQGRKIGEELAAALREADAFVMFSHIETQSVVLLEALCCGIPVISSRCGGPEEYITPRNGILVDVGREDQLAEAMEQMVKNREKYNAGEIRNSVVNMVSKETVTGKIIQLYKDVLEKNT